MYPEMTVRKKQDVDMWIRVVLLILILSAVVLFACASESRTSKDTPETEPVETITIGFVNSVQTADVWIIPDTEENRKTTVWGTASVKNAEPEKEYPVSIPRNDGDTYLLRMNLCLTPHCKKANIPEITLFLVPCFYVHICRGCPSVS